MKFPKKINLYLIVLIVIMYSSISAQEKWTAFTNTGSIKGIVKEGDNLWLASSGGFLKFNLHDSTQTKYTTLDGLAGLWLKSLALDSSGVKWIGTDGSGVSKFDGINWTTFTKDDGLPGNRVFSIVVDQNNNKWFGTTEGLAKYDGDDWTVFKEEDGLYGKDIRAMVLDKSNLLWVGTDAGISTFNGTDWVFIDSVAVRSMAVDQENKIWTGFYFGNVGIYDGQNWDFLKLGPSFDVREVWTIAVDLNNI